MPLWRDLFPIRPLQCRLPIWPSNEPVPSYFCLNGLSPSSCLSSDSHSKPSIASSGSATTGAASTAATAPTTVRPSSSLSQYSPYGSFNDTGINGNNGSSSLGRIPTVGGSTGSSSRSTVQPVTPYGSTFSSGNATSAGPYGRSYPYNITSTLMRSYNKRSDGTWWYCPSCSIIFLDIGYPLTFLQYSKEITEQRKDLGWSDNEEEDEIRRSLLLQSLQALDMAMRPIEKLRT